jgi:prepilin-type N-terminal cleavage/methylation domain-containing protein
MGRFRLRSEQGMTLIEVTVATALLSVVLGSAFSFFSTSIVRGAEITQQTQLQAETRGVLDQMVREIRQATSGDTAVVPATSIQSMGPAGLEFWSPDQATPYHIRQIGYTYDATARELQRRVSLSTDTDGLPWVIPTPPTYTAVLSSVASATFTYVNASGNPITTTDAVARAAVSVVEIAISIDPFPTSGSAPHLYKTSVHLRSMS